MDSLFLLIPLSVLLVFIIGFLFWWSVRSGQYDDMEGPAYRMLMDDDDPHVGKGRGHVSGSERSTTDSADID